MQQRGRRKERQNADRPPGNRGTDIIEEDEARYEQQVQDAFRGVQDNTIVTVMISEPPAAQGQQEQVVNVEDDKVINQSLDELRKAAKALAPGEIAVPSDVKYIRGEQKALKNAVVKLPDGSEKRVKLGYLRAVAIVVLDQGGNIINDPDMTITENVVAVDANAKALVKAGRLETSINKPVTQASNGVFYDVHLRSMDYAHSAFSYETKQAVTIKSGRRGVFNIQGNQIITSDFIRSVLIIPGTLRRFYPQER